jgi:hypothetical protein
MFNPFASHCLRVASLVFPDLAAPASRKADFENNH